MKPAALSWFVFDSYEYVQDNDVFVGSYSSKEKIEMKCQLWNNRYGIDNVEDVKDAKLIISFDSIEDSYLINHCKVIIDNGTEIKPDIELERGIVYIGDISGESNDGDDNTANKNNFYNIDLIFNDIPSNAKEGLKNIYLDIKNI